MYVCMYVCMTVSAYVCMHAFMYVCACLRSHEARQHSLPFNIGASNRFPALNCKAHIVLTNSLGASHFCIDWLISSWRR